MALRRSVVVVAMLACTQLPLDLPTDAPAPSALTAQCVRDEDCVLLPAALTCCLECPPVPPFHVAPAWVLDGMLIENETTCAYAASQLCPEARCELPPQGCAARAACVRGRCTAVAQGCDRPTS